MNTHSEKRLTAVHPELARRVRVMLTALTARGVHVEVVQGLRTIAEQDALFAQGRTAPGARVTNARGGQSNHNYGLAVDLCPFVEGKPDWNARESVWKIIGQEGVKVGLEWGGMWKAIVDKPHFQLKNLSIGECSQLYRRGGLKLVWSEATRRNL